MGSEREERSKSHTRFIIYENTKLQKKKQCSKHAWGYRLVSSSLQHVSCFLSLTCLLSHSPPSPSPSWISHSGFVDSGRQTEMISRTWDWMPQAWTWAWGWRAGASGSSAEVWAAYDPETAHRTSTGAQCRSPCPPPSSPSPPRRSSQPVIQPDRGRDCLPPHACLSSIQPQSASPWRARPRAFPKRASAAVPRHSHTPCSSRSTPRTCSPY